MWKYHNKIYKPTILLTTRTTNTIYRKTQLTKQYIAQHYRQKQYIEQHNSLTRKSVVRARFCKLYPGICLTTEEKALENLMQGSRRMPYGTMKTEYTEHSIYNNKNI